MEKRKIWIKYIGYDNFLFNPYLYLNNKEIGYLVNEEESCIYISEEINTVHIKYLLFKSDKIEIKKSDNSFNAILVNIWGEEFSDAIEDYVYVNYRRSDMEDLSQTAYFIHISISIFESIKSIFKNKGKIVKYKLLNVKNKS